MSARDDRLREVLREPHDEARAHANWDAIERRRARAEVPGVALPWRPVLGGLAVAAAIALAIALGRGGEPPPIAAPGPLAAAGGAAIAGPIAASVTLDDGSRITIGEGARLEVLENAGDRIRLWLREGEARFDVVPGGPRRWIVESGLVTVEVLGTEFVVDHRGEHVRVSVERGIVLVRGSTVPEGLRRLERGDSIEVPAEALAAASAPTAPAPPSPIPEAPPIDRVDRVAPRVRGAAVAPAVEEPAAEPEALDEVVPEPPVATLDLRLREADALRASGRIAEAVALLRAVADDESAGGDRAIASFTVGRIELDRRARPRAASVAFARAIELGLPPALLEDARARRVEALARVPDPLAAREAAASYLEHHPDGRWAAQLRRWSP